MKYIFLNRYTITIKITIFVIVIIINTYYGTET